jgi:hypothetical protein
LLCVAVAGCENKSTHPAASAKRFMRLKNEGDCIRGLHKGLENGLLWQRVY